MKEAGWLPFSMQQMLFQSYQRQREYAVDGIAEAIHVHFPLIEWGSSLISEESTTNQETIH
jgi:hypothetical protein